MSDSLLLFIMSASQEGFVGMKKCNRDSPFRFVSPSHIYLTAGAKFASGTEPLIA